MEDKLNAQLQIASLQTLQGSPVHLLERLAKVRKTQSMSVKFNQQSLTIGCLWEHALGRELQELLPALAVQLCVLQEHHREVPAVNLAHSVL